MLKCYLLDDELDAAEGLAAMLKKKFAGQVEVVGLSIHAKEAIEEIENLQPDVLFLDVEMPEMNGLDVLKHFPQRNFQIIFTTAHEKYALPALKAAATDYLVKPLSPQDVYDALQKCIAKKNLSAEQKYPYSLHGQFFNVNEIVSMTELNEPYHFSSLILEGCRHCMLGCIRNNDFKPKSMAQFFNA